MNLWRRIEEKVKPWMMVLAFIIILLFGFWKESKAEVSVELGPTFLSGQFSDGAALVLNETFHDKYRVGMGVIAPQEVTTRGGNLHKIKTNLFVHGQRVVAISEKFDFGIGVGYFNAVSRWNGSKFVASLSIEYNINEDWSINFRHWSNAGSASPNMGQDLFTVGYKF